MPVEPSYDSVAQIARVVAARIARFHTSDLIKARLAFLEAKEAAFLALILRAYKAEKTDGPRVFHGKKA